MKKDEDAFKARVDEGKNGIVDVKIDFASCKVDDDSGNVKLTQVLATSEEQVTTTKEGLAKGPKGVIGGFFMK